MNTTNKFSPAMQQYVDIKTQNPDKIIFFRLGDFYEFFFEDALLCAKLLDLVLTKKKAGNGQLVDMAGIPHHSYLEYAKKLVLNGYKVAIVEQLEDPKEVKGIVKRGISEIITPSTIALELNDVYNSYLCVITNQINNYEVYYFDIVTNQVLYSNLDSISNLFLELNCLNIKEIVYNFNSEEIAKYAKNNLITLTKFKNKKITSCYEIGLDYLKNTLRINTSIFDSPSMYKSEDNIMLSKSTLDNLEIFNSDIKANLFNTINQTKTMMGGRALCNTLQRPYKNLDLINQRLDQIQDFKANTLLRISIQNHLKQIFDIDKLTTRLVLNKLTPRGIIKLSNSVNESLKIAQLLENETFNNLNEFTNLVTNAFNDVSLITSSRFIKQGFDASLDEILIVANESKNWLLNYEANLKQEYDLKTLKIGFNKVFGYYIDLSKKESENAPEFFIRKQTLVNNERFITQEMKEKESLILNSEQDYINKQDLVFEEVCLKLKTFVKEIKKLSSFIGNIDLVTSNAEFSAKNNLTRPVFTNYTKCLNSRHLTIESLIGSNDFIANDYEFKDKKIILLTGPNMSGKSTYMRQIALIQIMAQGGLFVPAKQAHLEICDQIFTRIGAGDDLSSGKSTFLVEMEETSYALNNATSNSLIILDELGRGTSTYDGLSIAFGVVKYINDNLNAKTILATHYHELTNLESVLTNCINKTIAVEDDGSNIVFKHEIIDGRAQKSYGIHVATLANIKPQVISDANVFLQKLETKKQIDVKTTDFNKVEMISKSIVEEKIKEVNVNNLTPIDALNLINELKGMVK